MQTDKPTPSYSDDPVKTMPNGMCVNVFNEVVPCRSDDRRVDVVAPAG